MFILGNFGKCFAITSAAVTWFEPAGVKRGSHTLKTELLQHNRASKYYILSKLVRAESNSHDHFGAKL